MPRGRAAALLLRVRDDDSLEVSLAFKAYRRPFAVPVRTSRGLWTVREGIIVRLEDGEGNAGFGEVAPIEAFGTEGFAGALAWCAGMRGRRRVDELRAAARGRMCCAAAVAMALRMLRRVRAAATESAGAGRSLPVAVLIPRGEAAVDAMRRAADAGFRVFKLKIGIGAFAADAAAVARLAERLPEGGRLRLDANGGLDVPSAMRWLEFASEWPVEFVEQPLPADAERDLCRLAEDHETAVALDEAVLGADDIKRWRDRGWPGVFVVKPALAGEAEALLEEIRPDPDAFVFSSALETDVGMAAGVRLAFEAGVERALGYGVAGFFGEDGLGGGLRAPVVSGETVSAIDPARVWDSL